MDNARGRGQRDYQKNKKKAQTPYTQNARGRGNENKKPPNAKRDGGRGDKTIKKTKKKPPMQNTRGVGVG